jgi:hypothetical protein
VPHNAHVYNRAVAADARLGLLQVNDARDVGTRGHSGNKSKVRWAAGELIALLFGGRGVEGLRCVELDDQKRTA